MAKTIEMENVRFFGRCVIVVENPLGKCIEFLSGVQRVARDGNKPNSNKQIGHFPQKCASFLANRRNRFDSPIIRLTTQAGC